MDEAGVFSALSDRTRLKIVKILLKGEQCACCIPSLVGRAQPTVSLQLKKLAKAGIIGFRKEGKYSVYFVKRKGIGKLILDAGKV
jgi:ArsR family transcriptional regulator